jgi:hypothetical protein
VGNESGDIGRHEQADKALAFKSMMPEPCGTGSTGGEPLLKASRGTLARGTVLAAHQYSRMV